MNAKQEIYALIAGAEKTKKYDRPGYLAVMALILVLSRRKGRDISNAVEELRTFTHGECKKAIRIIRTLPEIQNSGYPVEEMVRLLRYEVMGKHTERTKHYVSQNHAV